MLYCKPLEGDTHYGSEADLPERQRHNNEFEGTRSNRLWCPYHQFGITGTHDAAIGYGGEAGEVCRAYRELEAENNLDLRVYLTIIEEHYQKLLELGLGTGLGSEVLKLGCVKLLQL